MNILKYSKFLLILYAFSFSVKAQDTLHLSRAQSEAIFIKENLLIIAEKLQIPQAEAMVLQAKLWPNPSIEIEEVNLWTSQSGTNNLSYFGEELPPFGKGSFGKNQQLGVSVEQLILTAGKRRKLVAMEKVGVEQAKQYFEEVIRGLKIEFRNQLTILQYLELSRKIYLNQINSITQLTNAYRNQMDQGNVSKGEYVRLKALELEIAQTINEHNKKINEAQKELKLLMNLPASIQLTITEDDYLRDVQNFPPLFINDLISQAKENRPDYKLVELEQDYARKKLGYEKAQRVPDLALSGAYDRGGNFMKDFVGFGLTMDLPFFNRNQGNITAAKIGVEQSEILKKHKDLSLENEVSLAHANLLNAVSFLNKIETNYETTLDELLSTYTKNFSNRNMSMLEYLDFFEAYLENKKIILEAGKEVNEAAEELNFTIGKDIIN
ncbi:TolC family protein [Marivirga lumbricoides]|uniref:TolC family protein n=1 Tax=Marivirga lumbricoides TaxID=1046115 RepID=A0A2T4DP64_9BACT|nr:TolC family protein [Marivirga lumbricoides]